MNLSQPLLNELYHEAENTRRYLQIVPAEAFGWKPHERSMDLGTLSKHIAELPGWLHYTINAEELDFSNMDYTPPVIADNASLLKVFKDNLEMGRKSLESASDENLRGNWRLRNGDHVIFEMPRIAVVRNMVFNHFIHHRGQLSVYLRLLDIKLPGIYGPSADEMG